MYLVKITFKDKPILEFTSDLDFQNIIEILYMKYGEDIGFEITNLEKEKENGRKLKMI